MLQLDNVFSDNVKNIEISGIRKFYNKVAQVPDALSLTLGQPDFQVPRNIKDAIIRALEEDKTSYTSNAGIIELRTEISNFLKQYHISYSPEEICITIGGSQALLSVFTAFLNMEDKVFIPSLAYPAYAGCITMLGAKAIEYELKEDFSIDFDKLQAQLEKERPKLIVISYPSNPTGAAMGREERDELYKVLKNSNTIIISDEIYSSLCFEEEYYSISQIQELKKRTVVVSGFSKMFSMTGLRIGYVCAEEKFMKEIIKVHQYNVSCAPSIVQWGALEGLRSCLSDAEFMKEEFKKRRDYVYERLINIGMDANKPKGAFYIFPSIRKFNLSSEKFCERMLKEGKLAVVPGSAFGTKGEGHIRISYSYSMDVLKQALDRLEKWIREAF